MESGKVIQTELEVMPVKEESRPTGTKRVTLSALLRGKWVAQHKSKISFTAVVLFILLWELLYRVGWLDPRFFSSPWRILTVGVREFSRGDMLMHLAITGQEFVGGFIIAAVVGVLLGIAMGWYPFINAVLDPFVTALYATPRIVLLPLVTLFFGIGLISKFFLVFLAAVFPILINTMVGISKIDHNLLKVARAFDATDVQLFRTLAIPASIPFIISGLRLGLAQALVTVIAAEMMISSKGIGYFVTQASAQFRSDELFLGIIIVSIFGVIMTWALKRVESRFEAWRVSDNK